MKKVLCLIALIAATSVSAQPPDVPRSRHDGLVGSCGSCVPASDGVIHFRFSPGSGVVTETIGGNPTKRLNLIMQVRGSKKTTERPQLIDQVSTGINYNETTFGPHLYTPAWFNLFGVPVANAQCTATRSDFFTGGEASYVLVVTDDSSSILGLTEETTSITNNTASPSTFATLTDKFVDFITITCNVIEEETEADISFTAVAADATGVRLIDANDANDPIIRRSILPVADNDLRGFRLDGKTWAEDYSRYSDGRGVRLKFSKGVYADNGGTKAALTAANFVVYDSGGSSTTITINDVEHTVDDPYVTIDINSAPAGAVIRLVSNGASTVKDIDDNELADGNFVASLEYDSNAPQVASITTDSSFTTAQQSRWTIVFDQPIHADTAIKENLCLTDRNGACAAADAAPTTPSIVSVIAGTADNIVTEGEVSTMTVVVNEGPGKSGGARSIEFRRNAILAGNLYIAEDYQTELRGQIQLTNRIGPVITVRDAAMRVNPNNDDNYLNYEITFTVTADEDVPDLDDPASYGLRRRFILSPDMPLSTGFTVNSSSIETIEGESSKRKVRIVYNATFNSAAIVQIARMVLVRASSTSLTDGDTPSLGPNYINRANVAVNIDAGEILDPLGGGGEEARVPNLNRPIITATAAGDAVVGSNARQYSGSFTVTVSDASNRVPGIGDPDSYVLLRKISGNNTLAAETGATLTAGKVTTKTAVINFSITLASLNAARKTEYFTLGIGTGDNLLDIYSNPSPIASGARISTGAASQANRVADNPRLTVIATPANPAANNANAYAMQFTISAVDSDNNDLNLSDIGDPTAYTLIHIPTSGSPIDLVTNNLITSSSGPNTPSGSSASLQYAVTFTDIADTQMTSGFTLEYAGNDKLLSSSGDFPARAGTTDNTGILSAGDRIDNRDAAIAARDTTAPYLAITNNPTNTVATEDSGATYTFSFTVTPSEEIQGLAPVSAYSLLVAPTEQDITNDNLTEVTTNSTLVGTSSSSPFTISYRIGLGGIRALLGEDNDFVPYGFLLARDNNAFRDTSNNEPVQVDADGNPTTTTLSSDNTVRSVLQLGKAAVLEQDQDGAVITLTADTEAVPDDDNRFGEVYEMTFTVSSGDEAVTGIGDIDNYRLMRVKANNSVETAVISGDTSAITVESTEDSGNPADAARGTSATFTYTVTFRRNNNTDVNRIRDTKGFTLALATGAPAAGALQNVANNPPVNTDGEEIYNSSNVLQRQGIIPPKPGNAAPSVMAARDTTAPTITAAPNPTGSFVRPNDDDPTVYSGSFTVSSTENIRDIGTPEAYLLTRIQKDGVSRVLGNTQLTSPSDNDADRDGMSAVINFSVDVGSLDAARDTRSFSLEINTLRDDWPRDYSNNEATGIAGTALPRDITAPVITVRAIDIAGSYGTDSDGVFAEPTTTDGTGSAYAMEFKVTASEDVPTLNNTASYNLAGISISGNNLVTINQSNVTPALVVGHTTTEVRITYTVTGITTPTSLAGFTLVRNGAESLRDKSGNLPNVADGARIDSNNAAIAARDTTPPQLTVTASSATAVAISGNNITFGGTFTVTADEGILGIGLGSSYKLIRVLSDNSTEDITTATLMNGANANSDNAEISYDATIRSQDVEDTAGFTLVRADNATASDILIDYASNIPVDPGDTSNQVNSANERLDSRDSAISPIDTSAPSITVTALDDEATPVRVSNTTNTYIMRFRIDADKTVSDIGDPAAYTLMRIPSDGTTPLAITTTGVREQPNIAVRVATTATIIFTGQFTATQIADEQDTVGFTLGRATDADTGGNCRLCGIGSIKPTRGGGGSGTGDIEAGARIDKSSASVVSRDTTAPQIEVQSDGNLDRRTIADVNGSSSGIQADGAFHVRFKLEGDYSDIPDIQDALTIPNFRLAFRVLRKVMGSDTFSVVNRRGQGVQPAVPAVKACRELQGSTLVTIPNCYYIEAADAVLSVADARNTDYFTLGRAPDRLRDASNNDPIVANYPTPNTIVRAVGDPSGPLPLNTTPTANLILEKNKPSITVRPSQFVRTDEDQICGSFSVSGADTNGNEAIDGINSTASYSLLRIDPDGTVSELTTAGDANVRCTGHGSVISSAKPVSTSAIPFPSLLNATIYFNVVDSEVTTAHRYTLGRKERLTDISGNPLVDTVDGTREITATADAAGRIDSRNDARGDIPIPSTDMTLPKINATVQDIDGDTSDMVEVVPDANNPLSFSGRFRVVVQQPDGEEENVASIGEEASYQVVYISITNNQEVAISNQTITISNVTVNRAATVSFTAVLPNIAAVQDVAAFKLKPVDLVDSGGNAPLDNEFTDTNPAEDVDSRLARRERMPPRITITAVDQAATADANDNYTMQFTVSANEAVATLGSASSYGVRRIDNDNNLRSDANATASNPMQVTANRQYTISYTANLSGLSATERRNTKGFTLVRVGTSRLIDRSGNPPVKADGSTAIANGAVIAAVTNNVVAATAVAARETARPRIEVRPVNVGGFGAVPHATLENTYEGSFTVRSVSAENIKGLGATASYTLQQVLVVGSNNTAQPTMEITSSSDSSATVSVTIGFQATFTGTQAEIDEAVRSTDGFTLSAGSLSLTDYASNLPQGISNVGDRLDTSDNAVAKVDRRAPRITVVAGKDGNAVADETDPLVYTGSFTVTAPADKPITGLATTASYKVLRISLGDSPFDVDNATITPQGTGDETAAMFAFTAKLADIKTVQKTKGFTLGYLANLRDSSGIIPQQFGGGRLDDREAAIARVSLVRVECAPFYPNIGQQDLFFKVTSESEPNLLTLTQGGTTLFNSTDTAVLMGGSDGEFAILKARVSSEITDSAPISVSYADVARTVQTSCAIDNLANLTDSDGDGVIDIVDSNPYDSSVTAINDTVASASLAATPASTDTFYNRRVLVRSLLRGNEFTYVEGGEIKMAGVTALTAAEYFGIDYAAKTHLLAVESDSDCALILAAAQENKLSQVNLAAFCASEDLGVAEEYDFVDKVSITESQRYVWVGVDSDGRLKPSEYPDHTISALPEINISGQSSYFYTEPPAMPKNIIISAYAPDATNTSITVTVKGTVVSGDPIADEKVVLQRRAATDVPPVFVGPKVYSGIHSVTGAGKNPQAGQTIRHWLIGDTLAATINVWHATEAKLTLPTSGGYTIFDDAKYAIGDYSHVDVRMAKDGSSEPITEIHQLLLYDVTETTVSRVTSAVQGRDYYLIADLTTNIENIGDEVLVAMPQGGYTIRTTANQESFELIAFRVNSDAGDTISVGWDKIGTAENILASYRVTADIPLNYNLPGSDHGDRDGDRILDDLDRLPDWPFSLPVAVDNQINPDIDWLGAVAWYDQPLYVSDEGLIIAAAKGNDKEIDYSAANIDYSGLTPDTRTQLGFTDDDSITSLATFGIRSVDYGFSQGANADAMVSGGIAYAVFPIKAGTPDQPLYISRYNEEAERWERFERGTHRDGYVDTWYVIDRESDTYCPLDVGVYRNEYMTAGVGFTANNQKCVLVAITDGGPYDNSGINGRIDALLAIAELRSPSRRLLQCAAFYPNVGQKELFFELNGIGFDANGFAIEQGGNSLDVDSALQINTDATDADPIVKLTLSEEIVSLADIIVTYTAADEGPRETMCVASLKEDTDDDGVADIVDNNPFDADDMKPNPDITGPPADNDDLFVESDIFYSRSVVVRSLLRGEAFTYIEIEEDEDDKPIRMTYSDAMTPAEYFGVDADARIYEYSEMCEAILATAQANGLSQVRLDEFCTEDISDDFVNVINNDFVEKGSDGHRYLWATVRDGFLVSSYIGEKVSILPEINFLGQDTYLFAGPTTKTVIISAYVGDSTTQDIEGLSVNPSTTDTAVILTGTGSLKNTQYNIAIPQPGETITRWLSGSSDIWQPKSETLKTREGGHDNELSGYMYAIGTHNNIDVRVADPEKDDPITEIRQVLLYEVTDSDPPIRRVTSMVAGRTYYVAVDFDTNIADEEIEREPAVQHMALYTITTATHHVARVRDAGHLEKEEVAIIVITVADDISTDTAVITVGWNKVGSVNNVISRYLVRNTDPFLDYALVDADLDGIPDDYDRHANDNHRLQVSIGDDIESDRDFLATQDGNPTFLTYEGLVIADALNNDGGIKAINYSVVNNGDLSLDTQRLLGIEISEADEIDTIATFGVAGVDYGFEIEGNRARPTGGEVYASFPLVVVDPSLNGETLYLGKYDYAADGWVRFERGTVVTWYAIDRPDVGACPTDVQVYQNQHQASGDEGMGFTAGPTGNCIMLVLSDGVRLYDSSSLDGRVLDPLSIGTKLFDKAREQPSQPHRRGGGGAIGVSDILLLIGALVLITVASRKRRKAQ